MFEWIGQSLLFLDLSCQVPKLFFGCDVHAASCRENKLKIAFISWLEATPTQTGKMIY
jgi:hypothetical protein